MRGAFRETHRRHPFTIDAIVVLHDHLHTVWTLPEGDADFAMRWQLIKSTFPRGLARNESISRSCSAKGERGIWQRRYWEHTIRDDVDFTRHVDYVHINPVKRGLVDRVRDGAPPRFMVTSSLAMTRPIGPAINRMTATTTVNGDREAMGFARAQPILRVPGAPAARTRRKKRITGALSLIGP
ncbi:transposase [Bradyrhizobium sp. A11]|uniref:REP-associated tyrosine transposase n=1 Tax=Bradyrhizobium sp. A11 TaxID=3133974 RepID=UPI0032515E07